MGFHVRIFKYKNGCKINLPPLLLGSEPLGITGPRAPSATGLLTSWEPSEGARSLGKGRWRTWVRSRRHRAGLERNLGLRGGGFQV